MVSGGKQGHFDLAGADVPGPADDRGRDTPGLSSQRRSLPDPRGRPRLPPGRRVGAGGAAGGAQTRGESARELPLLSHNLSLLSPCSMHL